MRPSRILITNTLASLIGVLAAWDASWLWAYRGTLWGLWEDVSRWMSL